MAERVRYLFGTVDNGKKIHIIAEMHIDTVIPLCRRSFRWVETNRNLDIDSVDCTRCMRTITYARLKREKQDRRKRMDEIRSLMQG
jgi:hypothetical protein